MESMRPSISVIVPVYNALPYLAKCLDSIMSQTFDHTGIEVLLIDDCSTDGSGELCDSYASHDDMFTVIHRCENSGGAGIPRNMGIERARGEYLFFLDDDDYLGVEAIERMTAHAREWDSDVLYVKMSSTGTRPAPVSMFRKSSANVDIYRSRVLRSLGPWKLFKKSFLDEVGFRFEVEGAIEDAPAVLEACLRAKTVSVASDYDYFALSNATMAIISR